MKRLILPCLLAAFALGVCASASHAQVFVRAPFVRVQAGGPGGVHVRAPFVNIWVPGRPPVYYVPTPVAPPVFVPPAPKVVVPGPQQQPQPEPQPKEGTGDLAPPQPLAPSGTLTLEQFIKSFQPKAGSYEVTLLNPITKEPTTVRFTLPEGSPKRVHLRSNEIEFDYGIRRFVRITFDRDGAMVTSH